jgi:hypothetical protein
MYSGSWAGTFESGTILNEISLAASRKRKCWLGDLRLEGSAGVGARATGYQSKTSPRTLPQAWSQLLPPRRAATELDIFLRLAERTLSRAPQVSNGTR